MDTDGPRAREGVAAVAAALSDRLVAVSVDVQRVIEREIPALRDDQRIVDMLEASVAENVATVVHALRYGIDVSTIEAPTSAVEYARRLAQRGVDAAALVRAYRIGQARFIRLFMEEMHDQTGADEVDGATAMRAVEQVSAYIDQVVGRVLPVYEEQRAGWLRNRSAVLASRVRSVLDDDRIDVDRVQQTLGYRLRQQHLGLVLWVDDRQTDFDPLRVLGELADGAARAAGSVDGALFVPCDDTTAWAWLGLGGDRLAPRAELEAAVAKAPAPVSMAVGAPASGVNGFRRTHRQALDAQAVAVVAGPSGTRLTFFAEVAPIAMMCSDVDSLRAWVAETLGPLAVASDRNDGLRETTRVFLQSGGSFTATAERLLLHRNTVQYRIRQAEERRGRPFSDGRLDVELALVAWHVLGPAVLQTT